MTREEMQQMIQNIGACENIEAARTMLADFQTSLETDYDALDEARQNVTNLTTANEELRSANMELFRKVGQKKEPDNPAGGEPKKKREFKDLFNDKGGIK